MERLVLLAVFCCGLIIVLSGCGGTTGWNVSFGVNPVTAVDNHQSLNTRESNYVSKGDVNASVK